MVKIKIVREWYEILRRIAQNRKISISEIIIEIMTKEEECLNLPFVSSTSFKEINVSINNKYSKAEIEDKIRYFLFCR
ncbi:hypothetical protein BFU36_05950 [Sulfolobus sp. A20]|uniref:hypothetical protein n=1 Tax=Sulfolobaceae TaxID=118883 RepID=UPI0008461E82|nr:MULTISPECIES: hypothetical protein [unclassified Sulfolobus]TRM76348.1 hypothetical protein DJ523_01280 [Sulfolobus sp. E5]TRM76455.1 hypothetical protein DJ532_07565 [Sulfolobus sp. A20-N-F8]TRM76572.1 hypothetical protein DJ528_08060 [Sulfolobus sp. B5]TRM86263.1 hypothetical protein DJ526_10035 [Sulfolobus sp. A20-N-G8]TRM87086.1 hypothetical protein DJ521_04250 [Sulfolobus sp. E3]TRM89747.1 hypothetical protein DJ529_00660 [Sulfolobus sp. C3]TRN01213.1 hypothetical protein DJ527_05905